MIAGGGAAATTAIVGSYFGAAGTVAGAAIAAVVTSVATTTFQRGLDTTTRKVRSRVIKLRRADPAGTATAVMPTVAAARDGATAVAPAGGDEPTKLAPPVPARQRPRFTPKRIALMAGAAAVAFVIGLFVVTGIEWIKGSPISGGDSGTSVGRVLHSAPTTETTAPSTDDDSAGDRSSDPRPTETRTPPSSQVQEPGGRSDRTSVPPTTTGSAPATPRGGAGVLPDLGGADGADPGSGTGN